MEAADGESADSGPHSSDDTSDLCDDPNDVASDSRSSTTTSLNTDLAPSSGAEALAWADHVSRAVKKKGQDVFGSNMCETLVARLYSLTLTTDFSGMGGAEEALRHLLIAFQLNEADVRVIRACDHNPHVQQLLRAHLGCTAPMEVQSDILDRMPAEFLDRLEALVEMRNKRAAAAPESKWEGILQEFEDLVLLIC